MLTGAALAAILIIAVARCGISCGVRRPPDAL
jgi:hypothetical protein